MTAPVLAGMVISLAWAARYLTRHRTNMTAWPRWERLLATASVSVYLGWTSMALWVNIATILQAAGAPVVAPFGTIWQLGLIAAAAGLGVLLLLLTDGSPAYGLTVIYALLGITISTATAGHSALATASAIGVLLIALTTVLLRERSG